MEKGKKVLPGSPPRFFLGVTIMDDCGTYVCDIFWSLLTDTGDFAYEYRQNQ